MCYCAAVFQTYVTVPVAQQMLEILVNFHISQMHNTSFVVRKKTFPKRCTEKIILFTSSYVEKSTNWNKARHQLEWTPIQWCLTARIVGISSDIKLICLRINFVRIKIYLKLIWWNLNHRYDWLQSSIFFINVWKSDEN